VVGLLVLIFVEKIVTFLVSYKYFLMVLFIAMVKIFLMTNTLLFLPNFYVIEYVFNKFISKVVISVCLFVCSIITHEPLDRFVSNLDWGEPRK